MDFTSMPMTDLRAFISRAGEDWPSDPDEVPLWRLAHEERARRIGYTPPGYRTKREFDAIVANASKHIVDDTPKNAPKPSNVVPLKKPTIRLSTHEAAQRFAQDVRRVDKEVKLSTDDLSKAYRDHCARHGLIELPENKFRDALSKLRGVSRYQKSMKNRHGRRQRVMTWVIEAAPAARPALKEMRAVA